MKLFKKRVNLKAKFQALISDLNNNFNQIGADLEEIFGKHNSLSQDFYALREELATNGVVRDLRKAEKEIAALKEQNKQIIDGFTAELRRLNNNGMATAVNKLNAEVFGKRKEDGSIISRVITQLAGGTPEETVTLAGKVDAIIEHLGVDITVKPKEVIPSKIVTKKVKTQKKGRK